MRSRTLGRLALVVALAGAMALAAPQLAISSVEGDRNSTIAAVDDPSGYLGITDNSANVGRVDKDAQEVFYLDDNVGAFAAADVTATVVAYANCTTDPGVSCPDVSVGPTTAGHDFSVAVSCEGTDIQANDLLTVRIEAASGVTVLAERTTGSSVETKCSGNTGSSGGFSSVTAGDVTTAGDTQTFSFSLNGSDMKSKGTVTIDLSDATGVDYSGATASTTAGSATFVDADTIEFSPSGKLKTTETVTISVDGYTVTDADGGPYTAQFVRSDASGFDTDDFDVR